MKLELLEDLYKQKLAELHDAEQQLLRFLPKLSQALQDEKLRELFDRHIEETKVQSQRLEHLMARHGIQQDRKSKAMNGLLADAKELLKQEAADPQLLALALTSTAQDVEGYEINGYACAHSYARLLGFHDDLKPLEETFHEEEKMEEQLVTFAESLSAEELESEAVLEPTQAGSTQ